jgi:hypothetical protein
MSLKQRRGDGRRCPATPPSYDTTFSPQTKKPVVVVGGGTSGFRHGQVVGWIKLYDVQLFEANASAS